MHVSVYHNVSEDIATRTIFGYQTGHPLVRVFETDMDTADTETPAATEVAEWAWLACNMDLGGDWHSHLTAIATAYRHCGLRSLSVGDVVAVGDPDDRVILKVDSVGFSPVDGPLNVTTEHHHGTWPWTASARTATAWILRRWSQREHVITVHPSRDAAIGELAMHARSSWTSAVTSGAVFGAPPASDLDAVTQYYSPADVGVNLPSGPEGYSIRSLDITSPRAAVPAAIASQHPCLALDFATADGRAIYDLFSLIKRAEERGFPDGDIVSILTDWFTSCGINLGAEAPDLAE